MQTSPNQSLPKNTQAPNPKYKANQIRYFPLPNT